MNKKVFLTLTGLAMSISLLAGCDQLHIHNVMSPFEYSDSQHWKTCSSCGEKIMIGDHAINDLTSKCLVCDYVDPIVVVDEQGIMTGLTPHGKTKAIIDLPSSVKYVAKDALADSKVVLLNLSVDFVGYYEGAFDKENLIVHPAEEEVTWELLDGIYYNLSKNDVNTIFYDEI